MDYSDKFLVWSEEKLHDNFPLKLEIYLSRVEKRGLERFFGLVRYSGTGKTIFLPSTSDLAVAISQVQRRAEYGIDGVDVMNIILEEQHAEYRLQVWQIGQEYGYQVVNDDSDLAVAYDTGCADMFECVLEGYLELYGQ